MMKNIFNKTIVATIFAASIMHTDYAASEQNTKAPIKEIANLTKEHNTQIEEIKNLKSTVPQDDYQTLLTKSNAYYLTRLDALYKKYVAAHNQQIKTTWQQRFIPVKTNQ